MARLIKVADWSGAKRGNVVFVHGLGGHPYDTWRRAPADETFWPLLLAEEVKGVSVHTLGYISPPTNWLGTALPLLDEAAHILRVLLNADELRDGPIAFVCHSLGGLIVKQVLRAANEQRADPATADFLARTRQVVFIATPHTGSAKATLMERLSFLAWGSDSARGLVANRPELRDLNFGYREFVRTRDGDIRHLAYYEMVDTLLGGIVAPDSADPGLPDCRPTPIREDHSTIAKPRRRDDLVFVETRNFIRTLAPEPADPGVLRTYPLAPFAMEWTWWQLVPKLVRLAAIVLLALALWQGVPRLHAALSKVEQTHELTEYNKAKIDEIVRHLLDLKAKAGTPPSQPEVKDRNREALTEATSDLAKRSDDRSKRALELLEKGDTKAAEALFAAILDEKAREGETANREAANAARNIAAFTRLGDVTKAAALYSRAAKLDPDNVRNWIDLGDMEVASGRLGQARSAFSRAFEIAERLAKADPGNAGWQRDLSISHDRIGDVLRDQGNLTGALDSYRASLAIRERLAKADPGNAGWQRDLSVSHNKIGDVLRDQGNLTGALDSYRASLAIRERLAKANPGNAGWQRDLSVSHNKIGDVLSDQGNLNGALDSYRADLAIAERLAKADPGNAEWQRDLSISHIKIGDVLRDQGNLTGALDSYKAAFAIAERLAKADPGNAGWQRDLSVSHNKIGDVLRDQGNLTGALDSYRASLAIAERLAKADPGNAGWQRDLSVSHNKIGDVLRAQGNLTGALDSYRASLAIRERLAKADPGNAEWQRDLSVSHNKIGDVRDQGNLTGALDSYRASLAIAERLAKADPGNAGWQRDLALSLGRIAAIDMATGRRTEAVAALRRARGIVTTLVRLSPYNAALPNDLAWIDRQLTEAGR